MLCVAGVPSPSCAVHFRCSIKCRLQREKKTATQEPVALSGGLPGYATFATLHTSIGHGMLCCPRLAWGYLLVNLMNLAGKHLASKLPTYIYQYTTIIKKQYSSPDLLDTSYASKHLCLPEYPGPWWAAWRHRNQSHVAQSGFLMGK